MPYRYLASQIVTTILLLLTPTPVGAQTYWVLTPDQSGDWLEGSNWTNGEPTTSTDAAITNGGTAIVTATATCNNLRLGTTDGSGTIEIRGGSLSTVNGMAYVGDFGSGNIIQSDGDFTVPPGFGLFMGNSAGGMGTYNLTGGSLSGNCLLVGGSGTADFTQFGGTNSALGWLIMAAGKTSSATYNLEGTAVLTAKDEYIGLYGTAHFTQTGGIHTVIVTDTGGGSLQVGNFTDGLGIYDLIAGQLFTDVEAIGQDGKGIFTQRGGTNTASHGVSLGSGVTGDGTYNLEGGTLITNGIATYFGKTAFNFGGGTLKASAAFWTAVPMTLTHIGGDANVDTTSGDIRLYGILSGSGGLKKLGTGTLSLFAGNTYGGDTTVSAGRLNLDRTGSLVLDVNDAANSRIGVASGGELDLFGTIKLDVSDVMASSKSWTLVSNSGTTIYESSFTLAMLGGVPFTQANDVWSCVVSSQQWTFSEATGVLSLTAVPEPYTVILLGLGFFSLLGSAWQWRKYKA
jgi:fibronectin-binding autotransporter adhesin